jgi:acetyl-CoA carboxylase alpha subunit
MTVKEIHSSLMWMKVVIVVVVVGGGGGGGGGGGDRVIILLNVSTSESCKNGCISFTVSVCLCVCDNLGTAE